MLRPGDMAIMMRWMMMWWKWSKWWKNEQTQGDSGQGGEDAMALSRVLVTAKVLGCGRLKSQRLTDSRWQNTSFYRVFQRGLPTHVWAYKDISTHMCRVGSCLPHTGQSWESTCRVQSTYTPNNQPTRLVDWMWQIQKDQYRDICTE